MQTFVEIRTMILKSRPGDSCGALSRAFSQILCVLALTAPSTLASDPIVGFTEPFRTIELAASETGTLAELHVQPGAKVSSHQVVGSLDCEVLQALAKIVQARLDFRAKASAAQIRLDRAKHSYQKLRQIHDEGHGGARELQIAETDLRLAQTDVQAVDEESVLSKLELKRIDAEIRRRQIVSPINGVVTELHREVGEFVALTEPNVLTIVDLDQLRIRFYPPTQTAEPYKTGQKVSVEFVHSGKRAHARIEFIAPVIDADSNTVRVDVVLDNGKSVFRSGRKCILIADSNSRLPTQITHRNAKHGEGLPR